MVSLAQRQRAGAALALALLVGTVLGVSLELGSSAPVLAWSNNELLASGGSTSRAVYQVASADQLAGHLVLGALGKAHQVDAGSVLDADLTPGSEAELVVVFLGSQVDASSLRRAAQLPALQPLSSLLDSASSSLVLPFLQSQGASMLESLMSLLQGVGVQVVGCTDSTQDVPSATRAALERGPQVLLVCPTTPASQSRDDALAAEVEELTAVTELVKESGKRVVFVYAGSAPATQQGGTRRRLQSTAGNVTYTGFGNYTYCDDLCRTQTRWLEGMLGLTILALAASAGMTCLYMLNTPSRFESVKEGSS